MIFLNKLVQTQGDSHSVRVEFLFYHHLADLMCSLSEKTNLEVQIWNREELTLRCLQNTEKNECFS